MAAEPSLLYMRILMAEALEWPSYQQVDNDLVDQWGRGTQKDLPFFLDPMEMQFPPTPALVHYTLAYITFSYYGLLSI